MTSFSTLTKWIPGTNLFTGTVVRARKGIVVRARKKAASGVLGEVDFLAGKVAGGGGLLPHMGYTGMWRCEGYGFQAVYSSIGYINQSVWV